MASPKSDTGIPLRVGDEERPTAGGSVPTRGRDDRSTTDEAKRRAEAKAREARENARHVAENAQQGARDAASEAEKQAHRTARRVGEETKEAREAVREAGENLRHESGRFVDEAKEAVKEGVRSMGQELRDMAEESLHQRRRDVASRIGRVADGLSDAEDTMRGDGESVSARLAAGLGERVRGVADYVENTRTRDMLHDIGDMARREPAMFVAGAFVLGLAAARFLKASGDGAGSRASRPVPEQRPPHTPGTYRREGEHGSQR